MKSKQNVLKNFFALREFMFGFNACFRAVLVDILEWLSNKMSKCFTAAHRWNWVPVDEAGEVGLLVVPGVHAVRLQLDLWRI